MISEHATEWLGYPVLLFDRNVGALDYKSTVYRLAVDYDDDQTLTDLLEQFLENPASQETPAIIIGAFGESDTTSAAIIAALANARDRLPNLKGIFLGDIISEENEISWIQQSDISPLFEAYPNLQHLRVRGNDGLSMARVRHNHLKSLVIETGGLSVDVIAPIFDSTLPALESLELWLGTDEYGWDGTVEDLETLFGGGLFPNLKILGLRDSIIADEIAEAISTSPILERLEVLDLSLGTLSDVGGRALLASPAVKSLKKLDLHYHYLSEGVIAEFRSSGISADLSERQKADSEDDRYVAVSE